MKGIRAGLMSTLLALSCRAPTPGSTLAWLPDVLPPAPPLSEPVQSLASVPHGPACAVLESGRVACWGCAPSRVVTPMELPGEIMRGGDEPRRAKTTMLPLRAVEQVVLSSAGACALQSSGEVDCWGAGFWSALRGDETSAGICTTRRDDLKRLRDLPPFESVAMTLDGRLCGVTRGGSVACAGKPHPRVPRARSVAAGEQHFCALGVDGSVTCWGENDYGQCAASSEPCVEDPYGNCPVEPTRASLPEKARGVTAGARHSCAVLESGRVACWGYSSHDALGFASTTACHPYFLGFCTFAPTIVPGLTDVEQVVASRLGAKTWALLASGEVIAWPGPSAVPERPLGEPCRDLRGVLSSAEVVTRHHELHRQRIRVRGRVSTTQVLQQKVAMMGSLALHPSPSLTLRPGEELVVDGRVVNLIVVGPERERQSLPAIEVFDVCRAPAPR